MPSVREFHPYGTYIPKGARAMIIGSFPIGKFSHPGRRHEIKANEIDFFFGGEKNLLWKLMGDTFGKKISSKSDIVKLLTEKHLGIGDVIHSCVRRDGKSSDSDLLEIEWNDHLLKDIHRHKIRKIFFTGRRVEKWFFQLFPEVEGLEFVTLISPSAQSARALGRREDFRQWRKKHPNHRVYDFILRDYQKGLVEFQD